MEKVYVKTLEQEAEFLANTLTADERVFVPGDKEFDDYLEAISRIDVIINNHSKMMHDENFEVLREHYRHEERMKELTTDEMEKDRRFKLDSDIKYKEHALNVLKENNRHEERLAEIEKDRCVAEATEAKNKSLAKLFFGAVLLVCCSEETRVLSKTALDVAKTFVRIAH